MVQWVVILVLAVLLLTCCVSLSRMKAELKEVGRNDRMKRAFMNNISNEVRSPLRKILTLADVVAKDDLFLSKNEKHDIADQLRYSSNLIGTMVDEILMFTDNSADGHQLKDEMFSPNALCRRCLEANVDSIYHRKAVKLKFKRELSEEFFLKSDRHLVEAILNKLILNACRFTEEGQIIVGCNTSELIGRLLIFVQDTGQGLPEHRVNSLFTWFEKPDEERDNADAELDLSICQKLAQKLGGELQVDPMQQEGTRMMLLLPLKS